MGYVHNTDITKFVSPFEIVKSAGTWTPTIASNLVSDVRTAAGAAFTVFIPIDLPGSHVGTQGAKIISIDVWYKIGTAAASDFAVPTLHKTTLSADTVAVAGAAVTVALDAAHDTAAELKAVADHKMTITPAAPFFIQDDEAFFITFAVTAAATTVFTLFGAQINYTLRL